VRGRRGGSAASLALKLLGLALLLTVAVAGGIALGRGETPLDWIDQLQGSDSTPAGEVAQVPTGELSDAAPADQAANPALAQQQNAPPAQESGDDVPAAGDDATDDPTATADPVPTEVDGDEEAERIGSPKEVVTLFAELWASGDYGTMYDLLSEDAQAGIARQAFIDRYTGVAQEAGITAVMATVSDPDGQTVPMHVQLESSLVGTIEQENALATIEEDAGWRIEWTPSALFAGLEDDCIEFTDETLPRGDILDRDGDPLAIEGIVNQVGIIPGQLENETQTIAALSRLLDMRTSDIRDRYEEGNPEWFWPITDLPDPLDTEILNAISNMPGVAVREKSARIYPEGPVAAHITGYVTAVNAEDIEADESGELVAGEMIGRAGIEAAANDILAGKPGGRLSIVSCATRVEQEVLAEKAPVPPQDVILAIDIDFQRVVDAALGDVQGSAVIIDPQTGAIMALVSHPTFDPNLFIRGLSESEARTVYDERKRPLHNRATQQGYPTGSIFKVITFAAAMEHLGYEPESEIYCPTDWSIPGTDQVWRDWTYEYGVGDQGTLNLHTALVNSCNTVFYELGYELDERDNELLPAMTRAFGLGEPTGIPYFQEIAGTVPTPEWKLEAIGDYWATGDAVNLSIGQGFLEATPLQMANAYAAIANGGTLLQPFIVEALRGPDGASTTVGKRTVIRELPVGDDVIAALQSALRDQTSNSWGAGSVTVFGDFTWPIAGKTGTAQNQMTVAQTPHSWFAAFGPYGEEAEIASIVMVESVGEGVSFAAPTTREIYLAWLGGG
jgi:penicillin-binding protein 2